MVYKISIGLLLMLPWVLFGTVLFGAASSAVGRWLGRRRRPYRVGIRRRPVPFRVGGEAGQNAMRGMAAGITMGGAERSLREARQAALRRAA